MYFFPDGLKYRTLVTAGKYSDVTEWHRLKIVRSRSYPDSAAGVIVSEGETDGAQLALQCTAWDVAILPVGAKGITGTMLDQLRPYDRVLVALDADRAGDEGAARITEALSHAQRLRPPAPAVDWCDAAVQGLIPDDYDPLTAATPRTQLTYSIRELLDVDLGEYDDNNWFADPIAPIAGLITIHGKKKSLKSFIMFELARAIACGDAFAGGCGFVRPSGPGKVLMFQMEIPPWYFQQRAVALLAATPRDQHDALLANLHVRGIADGQMLRLKLGNGKSFMEHVLRSADECGAEVLAFDPVQRMTGSASLDKANEVDALLDAFAQLQQHGYTVIFSHHNNKASGRASKDSDSMSGSQRFSGDPDALCSVWTDDTLAPDDNEDGVKERNFTWELRNGYSHGRSVRVSPVPNNPQLMTVTFGDLHAPMPEQSNTYVGPTPTF